MGTFPKLKIFLTTLFFSLLLSSCGLTGNEATDNQIWIDVPLNGIHFEPGQSVNIEGHAANDGEDLQVGIWVNALEVGNPELVPANGNLSYFTYNYLPPGPGDYVIQVVLVGGTGENLISDTARITVGGDVEETVEITPSPTATTTPELTLMPSVSETPTQTRAHGPILGRPPPCSGWRMYKNFLGSRKCQQIGLRRC